MRKLTPPTPEYEHKPCPVCGARTEDEAGSLCKVIQDYSGEYNCQGGAEETSFPDGRLRFETAASLANLDAYYGALMDEEDARALASKGERG